MGIGGTGESGDGGQGGDPEQARNAGDGTLAALSRREHEVLGVMAEGRSNAAIAQRLVITERAVAKHTASIFLKLGLQQSDDDNRRVLAVLAYLSAEQPGSPDGPAGERPGPGWPSGR